MIRHVLAGAAAGAAGTTALNAVTYLDMAVRGRGASDVPEEAADRLAASVRLPVRGSGEHRDNRLSGIGALLGIATGVGVGALLGLAGTVPGVRPDRPAGALATALAAMVGANLPLAVTGISDPRTWRIADWAADAVPHLVYGAVTAGVYGLCRPRPRRHRCCR
ncbi:hypothetical protein ACFV3R_15130 [Streptomyces sp. NPDC059740]|uniref:hypothetical protein n=1 Tax=Streptomyces sp. NPDC059740 TaxID=3346926 RepID=UPI00365B6D6C